MPRRTKEQKRADLEWAIREGLPAVEITRMLEQLLATAPPDSAESTFARLTLAQYLLTERPFRSASLARSVAHRHAEPRAYRVLGLALTVLGHFRAAVQAYRSGLELCFEDPETHHNLGHLLDVALDRPQEGLVHLGTALRLAPEVKAIALSHAHALARVKGASAALELLCSAGLSRSAARTHLRDWGFLPPA